MGIHWRSTVSACRREQSNHCLCIRYMTVLVMGIERMLLQLIACSAEGSVRVVLERRAMPSLSESFPFTFAMIDTTLPLLHR
jgi:hypothetical protein